MARLPVGDYLVDDSVLIERKTHADFASSLADGRLFPQAAALARSPHRTVVLLEGPSPAHMPDVHPHALTGAMVSLAVMWRLPLLQAHDVDESLLILTFLAPQARRTGQPVLKRYGSKPKRLTSRSLHILQGFPGVGPALAQRLLARFGSVEGVVTAEETPLTDVRGFGPKKAMRLRETAREGQLELARASAMTTAADESHSFGPENSGK